MHLLTPNLLTWSEGTFQAGLLLLAKFEKYRLHLIVATVSFPHWGSLTKWDDTLYEYLCASEFYMVRGTFFVADGGGETSRSMSACILRDMDEEREDQ